ncbi:MAG: hypothetical protein JW797_04560 [Bradymonadales bacterium]|nr:hypothetical protein [Bradymonadales bacterium]
MQADPAVHDCGAVPQLAVCEVESTILNSSDEPLVIDRIAQDVSFWGAIGLVEERTGFTRTLPYTMEPGEQLRLLFSYRYRSEHDEPPQPGAMFVRYTWSSNRYELQIPIDIRP